MKRKVLWMAGILLLGGGMRGQAEDYDELWKQVKQHERQDLPKSALEVVEQIADKAGREQHKGQRMAALLYGCKLRQAVAPDSFYTDILKLEQFKRQAPDEVERAVMASALGKLYADNAWRNRNDSRHAAAHPDSVREWSAAQFRKASKENCLLSMTHPDLLAEAKAADYLPLVEKGRDASVFRGDLLNVVGRRAIATLGGGGEDVRALGKQLYGRMLAVYRRLGNREGELLLMLDSVDYDRQNASIPLGRTMEGDGAEARERQTLASSAYLAYRQLLSRFGDLPMAGEIYLRMMDLDVTDSLKVRWAAEGYEKYEAYPRAKELLNRKKALEAPCLSLRFPPLVHPDMPFECVVEHRNLSGMELQWYLMQEGRPEMKNHQESQKGLENYVRKYGCLQKTERLDWQPRATWAQVEDTFLLSCPGVGEYVVIGKVDGASFSSGDFVASTSSSRLEVVSGVLPDSTILCSVVDGRTGAPVADAEVGWQSGDEALHSARTDAEGKARWNFTGRWADGKRPWSVAIKVRRGDDRCHPGGNCVMNRQPFRRDDAVRRETRLYADRAIYRPGQTVYVGGICWDEFHTEGKVVDGQQMKLTLCDPNGKTVEEQTVESDAMGAFSAEFVLPVTGLSGSYVVRTDHAQVGFTVEEYKRPTFEVRLDETDVRFRAGDTLRLTGEAVNYNGVPLRQARVSAVSSLTRWFYRSAEGEEAIPLDTVMTDGQGRFVLNVPVRNVTGTWSRCTVRQLVEVSVMSPSGETQTARASFPLTSDRILLQIEAPCYMLKDSLSTIEPKVLSFTGAEYTDSVVLTGDLYRVREGKPKEKAVPGLHFTPNRAVRLAELSALPSGSYELALQAVAGGDTVRESCRFMLFSQSDTRLSDSNERLFYCLNDTVALGAPARIMVGSGCDSVSLYYMLFCENRVLEERVCHFSDSILNFVYPEIPQGADGMQAVFYYVKEGQLHAFQQQLVRRQPDSGLRLSWVTFRDRLQPGAEETWKLRVALPDGRPAPAQLMSVLYDASLDGIKRHGWAWNRYRRLALPNVKMDIARQSGGTSMFYMAPVSYARVRDLSFDRFSPDMTDWRYYYAYAQGNIAMKSVAEVKRTSTNSATRAGAAPMTANAAALEEQEAAAADDAAYAVAGAMSDEEEQTIPRLPLRDDLRETAFFYPRLRADSAGVATIHFTLPEGLTTWKFMALAHTEDLHAATFADEAVARKEVMAQLALPRFVRVGDRAMLSASLFNQTEKLLDGTVTMEVFDPATERALWRETKRLQIGVESDTVVFFAFEPDGDVSLPACRVLFEADGYADGEQRYLPVLEDKEWLTQTRPFVVPHKGDTLIRLDGLFQNNHPRADCRRLTVEYTANPLWYAVQALPSVLAPQTDDVLSLAAAYYASTLSSQLATNYPQMKTAAEAWQHDGGAVQESPLATQEDLTGIVLEETPWVADAETGTRRISALRQLFDANRQADLKRQFAEALGRLQRTDGSFGWFEGMSGNACLTRRAARLLLRSGAGWQPDSVLSLSVNVRKMMDYLAAEMHKDVQKDKAYRTEHKASLYDAAYWQEYLYLMQLCDASWMTDAARRDADYMQARLVEGMHGMALADKAEAAVTLFRLGRTDEASRLARSLREHLVDGPEGLHLEYPSNGFVGSDRKISVHTMIMEALSVAGGAADRTETDGLCRWLLSQKRLQDWGASVGSMDAVYALMNGQGENLTLQTADRVRLLSDDGEEWAVLQTATDGAAGLGQTSATVEGRELADGAGCVEVTKTQDAPASWGAAYAQFRLPLAEAGCSASGLRIRVETDNPSPTVGDRLTLRYVVTSDRDYEYVRLKAGRAACLEPVDARSGYRNGNGLGYYREVKDGSASFFFERLPKGTYVLEEECYVERAGHYSVGAAKLNGVYAPEFSAYGGGLALEVRP